MSQSCRARRRCTRGARTSRRPRACRTSSSRSSSPRARRLQGKEQNRGELGSSKNNGRFVAISFGFHAESLQCVWVARAPLCIQLSRAAAAHPAPTARKLALHVGQQDRLPQACQRLWSSEGEGSGQCQRRQSGGGVIGRAHAEIGATFT